MDSALTDAQIEQVYAAVDKLPPMPPEALSRIAVLFASLDAQERRKRAPTRDVA
jgi:hypothetical protein